MKLKLAKPILALVAFATPVLAQETCPTPTDTANEIEDALLYIEDNVPDTDVGVHGFFGDTAWRVLCVYGPDDQPIITFEPGGTLGELGAAEFFFESNEPPYLDWGYGALAEAFPEGEYKVHAVTVDGDILTGAARFTTVVAMAPEIISPTTSRDGEGELPIVPYSDITVQWTPVSKSRDGRPLTLAGYQVILGNADWVGNGDNFAKPSYSVHVGADRTQLLVPQGFLDPDTVYEIEVIAIEESGNQTIGGVSFFRTGS